MIKCTVLKDLKGHTAGYVRADQTSVYCRIQLGFPVQLVMVFSDESQKEFVLDASMREQPIDCEGKNVRGCYVFKGDELFLISDEIMRDAFERRLYSCRNSRCEENVRISDSSQTESREIQGEKAEIQSRSFPERRWPQPPCWDCALYCQGCWQEPSAQDYSDPGC